MYTAFKHFHMTMAILSLVLLVIRFLLAVRRPDALNQKFLKIVPHVIDTLLVVSIITILMHVDISVYPSGFIGEKALFFIVYIVFSVLTILSLRGRVTAKLKFPAFVLAIVSWLWLVHVAFSKAPMLLG
ncbi:SirB2 family protein [Aliidiomarina maris]|uniref:Invasion protein n=1 Tax=Aliidiomarina maris TaxID=531312 RepID=A0A327WWM8_9GAMM|nr:SirB2 family protein [Aliidiomarina maris]MCL5050420.1 SirB2 family protein [Bacillota bacterium]RAJ93690.1 putative membrane protein SirB2 [Aliidiomarina maris]RUO19407.1 invasion protein [Aliidiomarina maris]